MKTSAIYLRNVLRYFPPVMTSTLCNQNTSITCGYEAGAPAQWPLHASLKNTIAQLQISDYMLYFLGMSKHDVAGENSCAVFLIIFMGKNCIIGLE